jgi:hypothetical protein
MAFVRRGTIGVVALALAVLGSPVLTAGASAAAPGCGATLTHSVTLTADVGPCNHGDGLVVRKSGITVDLNGHKVFSDAPLPRRSGIDSEGLFVPADVVGIHLLDVRHVVVEGGGSAGRGGAVQGFAAGVAIEGGGSNVVRDLTARENLAPCIGEDFSTQSIGKFGDGIVVFSSAANRVQHNRVVHNGPFSGISLVTNTIPGTVNRPVTNQPLPTRNLITGNDVERNDTCFGEIGVRFEGPGASNNAALDNRVNKSFLEGVAVLAVNNLDFSGLFAHPATCQNRGFPDPSLPPCPLLASQPTNDNNLIRGNTLTNNGAGGPQLPAGPGPNGRNNVDLESRGGIQLLAFCAYGALNGTANTIEENHVTGSSGNGIAVGGCAPSEGYFGPLQGPPAPPSPTTHFNPFKGFTANKVVDNVSVGNNQAGCPAGPPAPCGARFNTLFPCPGGAATCGVALPRYDLFDENGLITSPGGTPAPFEIGRFLVAPPIPATPTSPAFPAGRPCDDNIWFRNTYGSAFPACTTLGGHHVGGASPSAAPSGSGGDSSSSIEGLRVAGAAPGLTLSGRFVG